MLHTAGEAESTAGHGDRRTGAGRPRYMALDWENRHVRVRLERPLHQAWVKLRESGGFQDDSSFSSGAPGRCRPGPGLGAGYGTGVTVYSIPRLFHPGDKINYPGVKISLE